ncbi:MAG TPA: hypothetical protein VJB57_02945 [Dehalococcoidia bacterium]|nr:hypothetical protein [Dehalococcoidia bacterium]
MNLTTRSSSFPYWITRRNHVVATIGLAIALAALGVLATVRQNEAPATTTSPSTSAQISVTPAAATASVVYYLVGTQEEADAFALSVQQDRMLVLDSGLEVDDQVEHVFLAIDSREREELARLMIQDLNGLALETGSSNASIVDLRIP